MKKVIVLISFLCGAFFVSAQQGNQQQRQQERWKPESTEWYHPVPPKVTPGVGTSAPSDAIILFDGKDLTKWEAAGKDGGSAKMACILSVRKPPALTWRNALTTAQQRL